MNLTFQEYQDLVKDAVTRNPHWRYGQALFNVLYEYRRDLSEQVRGGSLDPFHFRAKQECYDFCAWAESHWNNAKAESQHPC